MSVSTIEMVYVEIVFNYFCFNLFRSVLVVLLYCGAINAGVEEVKKGRSCIRRLVVDESATGGMAFDNQRCYVEFSYCLHNSF